MAVVVGVGAMYEGLSMCAETVAVVKFTVGASAKLACSAQVLVVPMRVRY